MDNICRICCSKTDTKNYIFSNDNTLYFKMFYLPINIIKNDLLPQNVCDECCLKINDFNEFCNKAIESEKKLRSKYLPKNKTNVSREYTTVKKNLDSPKCIPETEDCSPQTKQDDILSIVELSSDNSIEIEEELTNNDDDDIKPSISYEYISNVSDQFLKNDDNILTKVDHLSGKSIEIKYGTMNVDADDMDMVSTFIKHKIKTNLSKKVSADNCSDSNDDNDMLLVKKKYPKMKNATQNSNASCQARISKRLAKISCSSISSDSEIEVNLDVEHNCCMCFKKNFSIGEIEEHYGYHAKRKEKLPEPPPIPDQRPLRCSKCSKNLEVHQWNHHWHFHWKKDFRPYICALCERSFVDTLSIIKHALKHNFNEDTNISTNLEKKYVCDLCPEKFIYISNFNSHRAESHPEACFMATTFRCTQCPRTFTTPNTLRKHHGWTHHSRNIKSWLCNICGKVLSSRDNLNRHMNRHTNTKRHKCKTCGKRFMDQYNLKQHERVHTKEKPFVCEQCGKTFSQRSTLVIHKRSHSGARPFVCELCNRGFVARGLLSVHVKTCCL